MVANGAIPSAAPIGSYDNVDDLSTMMGQLAPAQTSVCNLVGMGFPPFLPNEVPVHNEPLTDMQTGNTGILYLTRFRLFAADVKGFPTYFDANIPLRSIESVDFKDMFSLTVSCKTGKVYRFSFLNSDACQLMSTKILASLKLPDAHENTFAFQLKSIFGGNIVLKNKFPWTGPDVMPMCDIEPGCALLSFDKEYGRMKFKLDQHWRICHLNKDWTICKSYPTKHIVPRDITDDIIKSSSQFRMENRFPSVVYRYPKNGAILVRCAQPGGGLTGWFGWKRCDADEKLISSIVKACRADMASLGENVVPSITVTNGGLLSPVQPKPISSKPGDEMDSAPAATISTPPPLMLVVDCRSYTAALANWAKGGGVECSEYYPNCEVTHMSIANMHKIRDSFKSLRLLHSNANNSDPLNYHSQLGATGWLQNLASLIRTANLVVQSVVQGRPVLLHCSDGWDRTPQITSLAQIMLDPYYRSKQGFCVLIEKEWLSFGHKFADRCGLFGATSDVNERSPIFLQWLDCVFQLTLQHPTAFQFNEAFLLKIVDHLYSDMFGTFFFNNAFQRVNAEAPRTTFSLFSFLLSTHCVSTKSKEHYGTSTANDNRDKGKCSPLSALLASNDPLEDMLTKSQDPFFNQHFSSSDDVIPLAADFSVVALRPWTNAYINPNLSLHQVNLGSVSPISRAASQESSSSGLISGGVQQPPSTTVDDIHLGTTTLHSSIGGAVGVSQSNSSLTRSLSSSSLDHIATCDRLSLDLTPSSQHSLTPSKNTDCEGSTTVPLFRRNSSTEPICPSSSCKKRSFSSALISEHTSPPSAPIPIGGKSSPCHGSPSTTSKMGPIRLSCDTKWDKYNSMGFIHEIQEAQTPRPANTPPSSPNSQIKCRGAIPRINGSSSHGSSVGIHASNTSLSISAADSADSLWPRISNDTLPLFIDPIQQSVASKLAAAHSFTRQLLQKQRNAFETRLREDVMSKKSVVTTLMMTAATLSSSPRENGYLAEDDTNGIGASPRNGSNGHSYSHTTQWSIIEHNDLPALWQPDSMATQCSGCHVRFTWSLRKHHCRLCGYVYCHACSSNFGELPDPGSVGSESNGDLPAAQPPLHRICNFCHGKRSMCSSAPNPSSLATPVGETNGMAASVTVRS